MRLRLVGTRLKVASLLLFLKVEPPVEENYASEYLLL